MIHFWFLILNFVYNVLTFTIEFMKMICLFSFLIILSNFQIHKTWLEQRAARKQLYLQSFVNGTISNDNNNLWPLYYRHHKHDLNASFRNDKKPKPLKSTLLNHHRRIKSKNKQQSLSKNPLITNDISEDSKIHLTTVTISPLTIDSTTNGITKSTGELNLNITSTTPKMTSTPNDHIKLFISNETTTSKKYDELPTTTEHSFSYNVVDKSNRSLNESRRRQNSTKTKTKISNALWGRWQKWTKCSRNCGGGVMSQSRHCLSRYQLTKFILIISV